MTLPIALALLAAAPGSSEPVATARSAPARPARNYVNFRLGPSSASSRPELCLEVSPIELVGAEACGTGSGFLHHEPDPEIAHFRAKVTLASWKTEIGWVQPRVGFGFAELQIGEDAPGFFFGSAGPTGVETAGPELGASIRTLLPVWGGFELLGELNLAAAYFPHAQELVQPQSTLQPTVSFTLGFGF
ncbi:MAG: hypothetical protein HYZ28_23555 [Myxococcales bacterium]|nr:hypothetical protein [Myxococcales bacterium]